jgi:branched-chain amino acid transport system ATP-binding protein
MQQAISIIVSEHARIRRVLMLVDELCDKLSDPDERMDTGLFATHLDYVDSYARSHLPKEEQYLFKTLRARDPESHALLDELEKQHGMVPDVLERLRQLLSECRDGSPEARQAFIEALEKFGRHQHAHMARIENELIPMAMKSLTPEDWKEVNEGYLLFEHLHDPLMGETFKAEFDQLQSRLAQYAPEPFGLGLTPPDESEKAAAEAQVLGLDNGIHGHFGHLRALNALSKKDWQAINEQYLHYDDPDFGEIIVDEIRKLQSRIAYYAPAPIGLGMERTHTAETPQAVDQVLGISELSTYYGRIQALNGIDLEINKGELVALVGSNGAGKTTLLRTISGLQAVSSGTIKFGGQEINRLRADRRVKMGIALIPEGRQVFAPMTVEDNLLLGAYSRPRDDQIASDLEQMYRLFPILKQKRKQAAGTLSGGQQQMLAMARALMARPQLLLLDEPSMGLAPILVEEIFSTIDELKRRGITIFLVEQNAAAALNVADRGYVIETGNIVLSGPGRQLLEDEKVKEAYLGG